MQQRAVRAGNLHPQCGRFRRQPGNAANGDPVLRANRGHVRLQHHRQNPQRDQVGAVDALKAAGDHRPNPQQRGALRGPVARRSGAVIGTRQHHDRHIVLRIGHCRVKDVQHRSSRSGRIRPGAIRQRVGQPGVIERATQHHVVVGPPVTIAAKAALCRSAGTQEGGGGRGGLDAPDGRDVIGRDVIAQHQQRPCGDDVTVQPARRGCKERRRLDEGRCAVPRKARRGLGRQRVPRGAIGWRRRSVRQFRPDRRDVGSGRPDVAQEHRLAIMTVP